MGIDEINKYRIILASKSPRRRELLKDLGIVFEVMVSDWTEEYPPHLKGPEIAVYLAGEKARSLRNRINPGEIIITADTVVWCNGKVLDKPSDREDAREIIKEISGNTHDVITGVSLLSLNKQRSFFSSTKVTFSELTDEEIEYYIAKFEPYDKAGAYGIQEWIGLAACSHIEGSYFNVMGLPVEQVYRELQQFIEEEDLFKEGIEDL